MTADRSRPRSSAASKRRHAIAACLDATPPASTPWRADELVLPEFPHYGQHGDVVWRFGKQGPNQRDNGYDVVWTVGPEAAWPTTAWAQVGRDLAMALLGRRPDRSAPVSGYKPITVHSTMMKLTVVARWAEQHQLGLPEYWDETIGPRLLADLRDGAIPRRNRNAGASDTLAEAYLEVLSQLWMHRAGIAHGPLAQPWPNFISTSPKDLATDGLRPTELPAVATEVIDPAVWWALIRFALRFVLVYGPDILDAWPEYLKRGRSGGAGERGGVSRGQRTVTLLEQFAADPGMRVPVNADGSPSIRQVSPLAGLNEAAFYLRNPYADRCRQIVDHLVAAGRGTRFWFGGVSDVRRRDGSRGPWVDHLDTTNIVTFAARLRDACYVLITALGALRDSETQGLRRGCVSVADGGLTLGGEIIKGNEIPEPVHWWIDPLIARCVNTLERLGDGVPVTDLVAGKRMASDRLFWRMRADRWGKAGLGPGARALRLLIQWINDNADALDLPRASSDPSQPAIPVGVTPHQLRVTFAAVAAMQPDGPLGVSEQLHDTFALAAAYMANRDEKWFEVHRAHRDRVTVARLRGYLAGGLDTLCGPGAPGLAADLHGADDDAAALGSGDDYAGLVETLLLAAGRTFGSSTLSHCRGRRGDARCATALGALQPDIPFTPNFEADVCFGPTLADDCRNVVYDPPDHLPVWDVALAAYRAEFADLPTGREVARAELRRRIADAEARIAAMEQACSARPRQVLERLLRELERYLDYVRFDADVPGAAAQYRHLYLATKDRLHWLRARMPAADQPDWVLPAEGRPVEGEGWR